MNFLSKLDLLMEQHGLNKHTLSQKCGVPYTTIVSFYEKGYGNAKLSTVQKLCDFFHVTIDYLIRDDVTDPNYGLAFDSLMTVAEEELLSTYRHLNDIGKQKVMDYLHDVSNIYPSGS